MITVMFDLDGVLADFIKAFTTLAHSMFGLDVITNEQQPTWDFVPWYMTKEQEDTIWKRIRILPFWWNNLMCLASHGDIRRIRDLMELANVYFVTSRVHDVTPVALQTTEWLAGHGIHNASVVRVSGKAKQKFASLVYADFSIEDNLANAESIAEIGQGMTSFLLDKTYNQQVDYSVVPKYVRIKGLNKYLDIVEEAAWRK